MPPCETRGHFDENTMDIEQEDSNSSGSSLITSTHPSSLTSSDYYSEFQDFWDQAKKALEGAYPSCTQPRNSRFGVLLLRFEDDDLGVFDEIKALKDVFESNYRYETETWLILTAEPEEELSGRIYQFRRKFCQTNREPNTPFHFQSCIMGATLPNHPVERVLVIGQATKVAKKTLKQRTNLIQPTRRPMSSGELDNNPTNTV